MKVQSLPRWAGIRPAMSEAEEEAGSPRLSAHALAALSDFLREQHGSAAEPQPADDFPEQWGLSQVTGQCGRTMVSPSLATSRLHSAPAFCCSFGTQTTQPVVWLRSSWSALESTAVSRA